MGRIRNRLSHALNVFDITEQQRPEQIFQGPSTDIANRTSVRAFGSRANERTTIESIYTRMAIDVASVDLRHVRLDDQRRYVEDISSGLNNCLSIEANLDQGARHFVQDIASALFHHGTVALVPIEFTANPLKTGGWDIVTMRVGTITKWFPKQVTVRVYNERRGMAEEITVSKRHVAVVENPLYDVMNEHNSTLQRLLRKLALLDTSDENAASGKLDMIIQLPYTIKSESRRKAAQQRREDIEFQLRGSQYGIAYTDATEKITQLNRGVENSLLSQVQYLTEKLYAELGLTAAVLNGTADEAAMLNYNNRVIEPVLGAIAEAMTRTFLTKTARTQGHSVQYFRDPFKLVPMKDLAELADKFTRNEIVSSNEFRGFIGLKPSSDPKADQLRNSNMPESELGITPPAPAVDTEDQSAVDDAFQSLSSTVSDVFDEIESELGAT